MTRHQMIKSSQISLKFTILFYLIVSIIFASIVHTDDKSELNTAYTVDQTSYIPTSVSYSRVGTSNNNGGLTKSSTTTYFSSAVSGYPPYGAPVPVGARPQPILQSQQLVVNPQPIPQAYPYAQPIPQGYAQPLPQPIPQQAYPYAQPIPQQAVPVAVGGVVPQPIPQQVVPVAAQAYPYAQPLVTQQPYVQPVPVAGGGGVIVGGGGGGVVYGGGGVIAQPVPPQPIPQQVYPVPVAAQAYPYAQPYAQALPVAGGGIVYGGGGVIAQPIAQAAPIIYSGGCDVYSSVGCGTGGVVYGGGIVGGGGGVIVAGGGGGVIYGGGVVGGGVPFSVDTVAPVSLVAVPTTGVVAAPPPCTTGTSCSQSVIPGVVTVPSSTVGTTLVNVPLKSSNNVVVGSGSPASTCLLTIRGLATLALSPTSSVCSSVVNCLITYISRYVQFAINALNYDSSARLTVNSQDENVELWKALEKVAGSISEDGYGPATTTTATTSVCTNDLSPVFARTSKGGAVFVNSCWARMAKAYPPFVPVTLKPGSVSSGGKFDWPDDVQNPNYVVANYYVLSAFRLTNFTLYYFRPCMSTETYTVLTRALESLNDISVLITAGNVTSANALLNSLLDSLNQLLASA